MGKGKRSKERKAEQAIQNPAVAVANNKTAKATKIALIVIAVVLVATLSLVFVLQSGLPLRSNTVYESDNFKISGTMMQYMFNAQYQSFLSQYYQFASYFGLNTNLSLKEQKFDPSNNFVSMLMNLSDEYKNFEGTWFDYFWSVTESQAKKTLVLCEAAKAAGVTLDAEDKKEIEDTISAMYDDMDAINEQYRELYSEQYGQGNYIQFNGIKAYLTATYGQGVSISDVRKTLELVQLSAKFYDSEAERLLEEIKSDDDSVIKYYNEHISDYYKADYLTYTFNASYTKPTDSTKEEETWNKYLLDIGEAMDHAKSLSECKTEEEFKSYMIEYWFEKQWQTQYDKTIKELKKKDNEDGTGKVLEDKDIPEASVIAEKKAKVLEVIIDGLLNEKDAEDFEPTGNTAFDGAVDAIRDALYSTLGGSSYYGSLERIKAAFDDSDDMGKWLFEENRTAGDNKYFGSHEVTFVGGETNEDPAPQADEEPEESGNGSTEGETPEEEEKSNWEVKVDKSKTEDHKFTVEVSFVLKPRYVIEDLVREFGHILISEDSFKEEKDSNKADVLAKGEAEKLLAQLKEGELTKESFETLAKEKTEDSGVYYEDVQPGDMVEEISDWLFDAERKAGDLEVVKSDYGYHVMYLVSISDKQGWFIEARKDLYEDTVEKWVENNEATYAVNYKGDFARNNINVA